MIKFVMSNQLHKKLAAKTLDTFSLVLASTCAIVCGLTTPGLSN